MENSTNNCRFCSQKTPHLPRQDAEKNQAFLHFLCTTQDLCLLADSRPESLEGSSVGHHTRDVPRRPDPLSRELRARAGALTVMFTYANELESRERCRGPTFATSFEPCPFASMNGSLNSLLSSHTGLDVILESVINSFRRGGRDTSQRTRRNFRTLQRTIRNSHVHVL